MKWIKAAIAIFIVSILGSLLIIGIKKHWFNQFADWAERKGWL